jgi:pimeloyl-ACP methyl ester carboxylesterase
MRKRTRDLPAPTAPAGHFIGEVHVAIEGSRAAPAVALIHGIPGSMRDFRYLAPALVARGLCAVRIDMPGFGQTPVRAFPSTRPIDRATFVRQTMKALGFARFAIAGHSFGGGTALLCAALFPEEVTAFIGINSIGPRRHQGFGAPASFFRAASAAMEVPLLGERLHALWVAGYAARGLKSDVPLDLPTVRHQASIAGDQSFKELRQAARLVRAPALVVSSQNDRLVEPASSFALARALRQGTITSHLHVADGGHFLQKYEALRIAYWAQLFSRPPPDPERADQAAGGSPFSVERAAPLA